MTTLTHGADVPALRHTAQSMCDAAEEMIATDLRVSAGLGALTWNGPDAMRARQAWDAEHGPALYAAARVLVGAGEMLLHEADDQEQASGGGDLPHGPPPGAVGVAIRSTLASELFSMRRVLDAFTPSAETVDRIRGAVSSVVSGAVSGATYLNNLNTAAQNVPLPPLLSGGIGALGVAQDAATLQTAWREGDLSGISRSLGSLEISAIAARYPVHGAAAGVAWHVGWEIGEGANRAMAGTRFEENFRERSNSIFDAWGAWGMLVTPGTLIVSGVETLWETAAESAAGDATDGPGVGGR